MGPVFSFFHHLPSQEPEDPGLSPSVQLTIELRDEVCKEPRTTLCCLDLWGWPRLLFLRGCWSTCLFGVAVVAGDSLLPVRIISEPKVFFIFLLDNLRGAPVGRGNARHWYIIHERNKVPGILAIVLLERRSGRGLRI